MAWDGRTRSTDLPSDWPVIRARVLERDGHQCKLRTERCIGLATEVDHIGDRRDHRGRNLRAVCKPCHDKRTSAQANAVWSAKRAQARHPREKHPGEL